MNEDRLFFIGFSWFQKKSHRGNQLQVKNLCDRIQALLIKDYIHEVFA